jgi:hypothetical protein
MSSKDTVVWLLEQGRGVFWVVKDNRATSRNASPEVEPMCNLLGTMEQSRRDKHLVAEHCGNSRDQITAQS